MHEEKRNEGSKLGKVKRWVSHVVARRKRPKIKAYFFPKDGPPYPIELPYVSPSKHPVPPPPAKRPAKPPSTPKPQTFFEKLKNFFFLGD